MKIKQILLSSLLFCGILSLARSSTARAGAEKSLATAPYAALDAYIEAEMTRLHIPGLALAVVDNGAIVHQRGLGRALADGSPPTPQTPFFIGSLTKSFTALAVMQLVEAGKIDLDAPVHAYLPWFTVADPHSAQISVRHLLHHTSGLSTAAGWVPLADFDQAPDAAERQIRALSAETLHSPPGTKFAYSNANYNLLGLIIEAVSGESYADYVQNRIFTPLEMDNSTASLPEAEENGLAVGHRYWFWRPTAVRNPAFPAGSLPSGQLIAGSEDMAHYIIALLNNGVYGNRQILSAGGVAEMWQGAVEDRTTGTAVGEYGMG
jgi:CubicO group peptidase (beta-lactamase class C family)